MFYKVISSNCLRIGKFIEKLDDSTVLVEFFMGLDPNDLVEEELPINSVQEFLLQRNTRIYTKGESKDYWKVGYLLEDTDSDISLIKFPGEDQSKNKKEISHNDFYVLASPKIADPFTYLSKFVTETPTYSINRQNFLKNYYTQRSYAKGISGITSSAIELEPHQLNA